MINTENAGSNPAFGAFAGIAQLVERQSCKLDVAGSMPVTGFLNFTTEVLCNYEDVLLFRSVLLSWL